MELFEGLKKVRSLEMLAYKEMKVRDFSSAQAYSNDHVLYQHSVSPFIKEMDYIECLNGYSTH